MIFLKQKRNNNKLLYASPPVSVYKSSRLTSMMTGDNDYNNTERLTLELLNHLFYLL